MAGRFDVEAIKISSFGYVERLKANWELHCEGAEPALFGTVDITNPPPPPGLEITLQMNTQGAVNRVNGRATVGGIVTCNKAATVNVNGYLTQRTSRVSIAQGEFSAQVPCDTTPTAILVTVSPVAGVPFLNGTAQLDAFAWAYDPLYPGVQVRDTDSVLVQLKLEKKNQK